LYPLFFFTFPFQTDWVPYSNVEASSFIRLDPIICLHVGGPSQIDFPQVLFFCRLFFSGPPCLLSPIRFLSTGTWVLFFLPPPPAPFLACDWRNTGCRLVYLVCFTPSIFQLKFPLTSFIGMLFQLENGTLPVNDLPHLGETQLLSHLNSFRSFFQGILVLNSRDIFPLLLHL